MNINILNNTDKKLEEQILKVEQSHGIIKEGVLKIVSRFWSIIFITSKKSKDLHHWNNWVNIQDPPEIVTNKSKVTNTSNFNLKRSYKEIVKAKEVVQLQHTKKANKKQ